jgi:nucleoside phosphorylase
LYAFEAIYCTQSEERDKNKTPRREAFFAASVMPKANKKPKTTANKKKFKLAILTALAEELVLPSNAKILQTEPLPAFRISATIVYLVAGVGAARMATAVAYAAARFSVQSILLLGTTGTLTPQSNPIGTLMVAKQATAIAANYTALGLPQGELPSQPAVYKPSDNFGPALIPLLKALSKSSKPPLSRINPRAFYGSLDAFVRSGKDIRKKCIVTVTAPFAQTILSLFPRVQTVDGETAACISTCNLFKLRVAVVKYVSDNTQSPVVDQQVQNFQHSLVASSQFFRAFVEVLAKQTFVAF